MKFSKIARCSADCLNTRPVLFQSLVYDINDKQMDTSYLYNQDGDQNLGDEIPNIVWVQIDPTQVS